MVIEELPTRLFRAWDDPGFAQAFLRGGHLRLRPIQYYKGLEESKRRDATEGQGHLLVPGDVPVVTLDRMTGEKVSSGSQPGHFNWRMGFVNPTYILCLSDPAVDLAELTGFGRHVIEVFSPKALVESLHKAVLAMDLGDRIVAYVDCFAVRYDKGLVGHEPTESTWRVRIAYGQKPPIFAGEKEYRCAVVLSGSAAGAPDYLDVSLGDVTRFASSYAVPSAGAA